MNSSSATTRRALLAGSLVLASASLSAQDAPRRLRAADNQSDDFPTVQALLHMDRYLRSRTRGRLGIQVFASGQLGEEDETIEQTRLGAFHLTRVNVAPLAALVPGCAIFSLPYLFKSDAQLTRILDSSLADELLAQFEPHGLVGLAFYEAGARSFYNSVRPVITPDDLRGLRIRTQHSSILDQVVGALGARPVDLAYSQLLPALQAGLIDGAENNWPSYVTTEHHRAARFYTLTEHARSPEIVLMSKRLWDSLPARDQDLIREAARSSRAFHQVRFSEWSVIAREQANADGVTIVTDFDRDAFLSACAPVRTAALENLELAELALHVRDME
jgi:tripartite ATP-independent transporter DctP family solute receptor